MDKSSASSSMGIVFDLLSLAAKPIAPIAQGEASPLLPAPVVSGDVALVADGGAEAALTKVAPQALSATPPSLTAPISDGPISVDALVAMDKTARQGLTAKPFIEKPAVEWVISVLSAAGLVKANAESKDVPATATVAPTLDLPSVDAKVSDLPPESIAPASPPVDVAETAIPSEIIVAEQDVSAPASVADVQATKPNTAQPIIHAKQPSAVTVPEPPVGENKALLAEPMVAVPQPITELPVKTLTDAPAPVALPIASTSDQLTDPVLNATALPVDPASSLLAPVPQETHELRATTQIIIERHEPAVPVLLTPTIAELSSEPVAPASVPAASAIAHQKEPVGVVAAPTKPEARLTSDAAITATPVLIETISPSVEAEASQLPTVDLAEPAKLVPSKKAEHATKAKSADTADRPIDPSAMANAPVMPQPIVAQNIKVTSDTTETAEPATQDEIKPAGHKDKPRALQPNGSPLEDYSAPAKAKVPATPAPAKFEGQMTEKAHLGPAKADAAASPASISEEAEPPSPLHATILFEQIASEPAGTRAATPFIPEKPALDENRSAEPQQGPSSAPFEGQSDSASHFQNSSSNQQSFEQDFGKSAGSAPSLTPMPETVTIEAVTIRSQHSSHEDGPSNATQNAATVDQPVSLSVFTDAEPARRGAMDMSPRILTPTANNGTSAASALPASGSPIRVDNPIFIAQRDKALQQQIISALRSGHDEIRLSLYPPQLGQVTINMALDGQKVKVGVKTSNREATNLLVGERQTLASALGHEGFTLEGFDVTDDAPKEQTPEYQPIETPIPTSKMAAESSFSLDITI